MKSKVLKVSLSEDKEIYRIIDVAEETSLYDLASFIIKVFDFSFDHCFGFYSKLRDMYKSEEMYELFVDVEGAEFATGAKSVKNNNVGDVFSVGKEMLFHFDYGDSWGFIVECVNECEGENIPPSGFRLVGSEGDAPEQYPDYDEE